ncbi:MAG: tRNA pseudouridine(55) synthase TruB [Desulfobulbaceae bacterium]|nr:tRNA pseudouridine(55) synthase TruB [Desulfobulbaceae bacterium]
MTLTNPFPAGFFLVDKPVGVSSFAVVRRMRRLLGVKKVGHAGTLDPFASGLLLVGAGREATRHIATFMEGRKCYTARLQLGVETDTQDPEGTVTRVRPVQGIDSEAIRSCLAGMAGEQMQVPPPFSALKHQGKPLYHYARRGVIISKPARPVHIYTLEAGAYEEDAQQLEIQVSCSHGTYIRTLAADIGNTLGCGAHLIELRRTASGPFNVADALDGRLLFQEEGARYTLLAARMAVEDALARIAAI